MDRIKHPLEEKVSTFWVRKENFKQNFNFICIPVYACLHVYVYIYILTNT